MSASGLSFDDFEESVASFDATEHLAGGDRRDLFNVPDVVYPSTDTRAASCKAEVSPLPPPAARRLPPADTRPPPTSRL
jgi:hypothetical protein